MTDEYTPGSVANLLNSCRKSKTPDNKALKALFDSPQPAQKSVKKVSKAKTPKHKGNISPVTGYEPHSTVPRSQDEVGSAPQGKKKKKKKKSTVNPTDVEVETQEQATLIKYNMDSRSGENILAAPKAGEMKKRKRKHDSSDTNDFGKKAKVDRQNVSGNPAVTPSVEATTKKRKKKNKVKSGESGKDTKESIVCDKEYHRNADDSKVVSDKTSKSVAEKNKKRLNGDSDNEDSPSKKKFMSTPEEDARTVFVGNLPVSYDKKAIRKVFSVCGKVDAVRIRGAAPSDLSLPKKAIVCKKAFHKDSPNIIAYVRFSEAKSVKKALKLNGHEVEGRHIRVDFVKGAKQYDLQRSVFVGNLPFDAEEEALREHFQDCGEIENVRLVRDKDTRIGKGFGFVQFKDKDGVIFAVKLDGKPFQKRALRVKLCSNMKQKSAKHSGKKDTTSAKSSAGKKRQQKPDGASHKSAKKDPTSFQGVRAQRLQKIKKRRKFRHKLQAKKKGVNVTSPSKESKFTKVKDTQKATPKSTGFKTKHKKFDD